MCSLCAKCPCREHNIVPGGEHTNHPATVPKPRPTLLQALREVRVKTADAYPERRNNQVAPEQVWLAPLSHRCSNNELEVWRCIR